MNIDGLGEKIIEDYYNFGYLTDIPSIYDLKNYKEKLKELEGFGEKSINNLLTSIENSKKLSLEKVLFGLGIRHFGEKSALILAQRFNNIETLKNTSLEELTNINDIGEVMARSIKEYFSDENNLKLLEKLKKHGLNMIYLGKKITLDKNFENKKFVITGTISNLSRNEIKEEITSRGGNVIDSVSKKTDVIVVGTTPGSKYDKAKELGIDIWNEEKLLSILGGNNE